MVEEIKSKKPKREDIAKIIQSGDVDKLLYLEETEFFEVRSKSYATNADVKWELQKARQTIANDVSSIANSGGGWIVIGLDTKTKVGQPIEYVSKLLGIRRESIQVEQWRLALREHLVPRLTFSDMKYGYIGKDVEIFWLEIPDAKQLDLYPILVNKAKWEVDGKTNLKGDMFALYHRDGAENLLESPQKIQQILAQSFSKTADMQQVNSSQIQRLSEKLDDIASVLPQYAQEKTQLSPNEFTMNAITKLSTDAGFFYIYAIPKIPGADPQFWDDDFRDENMFKLIKNPPMLRQMGWGLNVAGGEMPYPNGKSWEITNGNRKLLQVTQTGEVFGAVTIDNVLSHGSKDYLHEVNGVDFLINEVALMEYMYNFGVFIQHVKKHFKTDTNYELVYGFEVKKGVQVGLLVGERMGGFTFYQGKGKLVSDPVWERKWNDSELPQAISANMALDVIKGGFGVTENPFLVVKNEKGFAIDVETLSKLV